MKKKQRSWKKWTSHLSRRSGRIVFTARVTTLHSCCDFALVLLEKFSPSGQSEVRNILMYFINGEIGLHGQTSSSFRAYCKGTARKYFTQSTLPLITDKSRIAAVVIQPIMNRGLAIVLCKPVLVVQPDDESILETTERTTWNQTSRKTRTHRNKGIEIRQSYWIGVIQMVTRKQSTPTTWWTQVVSSRNVTIYISSDYIVRQKIKQFIIIESLLHCYN